MVESASNLTNNPLSEAEFPPLGRHFAASGSARPNLICPAPEISSCQTCRQRRKLYIPDPAQMKQIKAKIAA